MTDPAHYPADAFFDIETLINVSQAQRILLVGNFPGDFLHSYQEQKALLNQECEIIKVGLEEVDSLWQQQHPFDVAIVADIFEHIEKPKGFQLLSRLRDVLSQQYCICLPLNHSNIGTQWQLTDLFSFALSKVASYKHNESEYALFKYNLSDYKKTPDWLNADNWANPKMWGKYWW